MSLIVFIIVLCLIGLVVGAFARLALPGRDPMSIWQTIGVGIGGSLIAGIVGRLLFDRDGASFLLSVIFAAGIVYLIRRSRGGGLMDPGVPPTER
jgi:uncharacterized membrane protein YeaQ/YmgE (transglycosylase-associated protein family)